VRERPVLRPGRLRRRRGLLPASRLRHPRRHQRLLRDLPLSRRLMQTGQYSRTALAAAFYRAQHHLHDEPKLLDDPYAHRLLTPGEMAAFEQRRMQDGLEAGGPPGGPASVLARARRAVTPAAGVLVRARYTGDRLAMAIGRGIGQYVLVGAGLDTFAFRRADVRDRVQVFELDHPQSQAFKRERLAAAGLADPPNLHFGVVDFEREGIAEALGRLPFHPDQPAVFAWLGVTMYLTPVAIESTWRSGRSVAARGGELAFDSIHPAALPGGRPARGRGRWASRSSPDSTPPPWAPSGNQPGGRCSSSCTPPRSTGATSRHAPTATGRDRWDIWPPPASPDRRA